MKHSAINRLLEKAPAQSLAALGASAFARGDVTELSRIADAAAMQAGKARHQFLIQQHAMIKSALLWGLKLWQTHSLTQTFSALIASPDTPPDEIIIAEFLRRAHCANIASLIEAMQQICVTNGLDFDSIRSLAGFEQLMLDEKAQPIPTLVAEYVEMFSVMGQ
jgi:hypothetical protein